MLRILVLCVIFLTPAFSAPAETVRESILAGGWYPASEEKLAGMVGTLLNSVPAVQQPGPGDDLRAIISPHAGYVYSGPVAAYAYKLLQGREYDTVVIVAPSHRARFPGVSVYDKGPYATPLGRVALDGEFISAMKKHFSGLHHLPQAHAQEHSLEIQLPFLQTVLKDFRLVPLVMGDQSLETCKALAEALAEVAGKKKVLIVASSDLSHYHASKEARKLDDFVLKAVEAFEPQQLHADLTAGRCEACGGGPMLTAMLAARQLGADSSKVLNYGNSGDTSGDYDKVVGYMAAAFWTESGDPDEAEIPAVRASSIYNAQERKLLHRLAREAIQSRLEERKLEMPDAMPEALQQVRGAFVTLNKHGRLRGCIGHVIGRLPLYETVIETARAAAFQDPRFEPLKPEEFDELEFEISVLIPPKKLDDISTIKTGTHGLIMKKGIRSGLLLPQVATDYGWDATTFLQQTCRKAGLPQDCYKDESTEIYTFSAEVF